MAVSRQCANCGAALPADQPAGQHYCEKCAAAWQQGNASQGEDDVAPAPAGRCANCGAPLPADQPAGHQYCEKCSAAWQRGNASRQQSAH